MTVTWDDSNFKKNTIKKGVDGLEEWGKVEWHPKAFEDAPILHGPMRESLGVERDEPNRCIYVGGGGQAKDYILKQEVDRSLHHAERKKAGFIMDTVKEKSPLLAQYVNKHINE